MPEEEKFDQGFETTWILLWVMLIGTWSSFFERFTSII
jgi:hypothetical protein